MLIYITSFCHEFDYPKEAEEALLSAYNKITSNKYVADILNHYITLYTNDTLTDNNYKKALTVLKDVSAKIDTHYYTLHLLFYICLSKHTKSLYQEKNIPYQIYYDSMSDLKWKLHECYKMYQIWGNFVADWEIGFFDLSRFALGRLQFETMKYTGSYEKSGYRVSSGDIVLNMHIPSMGPLQHEDCIASYRQASEFFKEYFIDKPTTFVCYSWLLYPKHREFLPKSSNILTFMNDFDIISSDIDEEGSDLWRIFYTDKLKDLTKLPEDTSLQRVYKKWLQEGNQVGSGHGIFLFDGNII